MSAAKPSRRTAPRITVVDGQPTTTSRDIAATFGKRHDDVLRRIRALDCSPEFNARNFAAVDYVDAKGEVRLAYRITRDGFTFLCMGFTGHRAASWKERYIDTFNKMAAKLASRAKMQRALPRPATPALPAPASRITPEMEAAITARAFTIISSALPGVHEWLTREVLKGCTGPLGVPPPNFNATLEEADFAAYSTRWASKHLLTATRMLVNLQCETGELISRVQDERLRLAQIDAATGFGDDAYQ